MPLASTSRVTKKCGAVVQLCVVRSAIRRPITPGVSILPPAGIAAGAGGRRCWRGFRSALGGRFNIRSEDLAAGARPAHAAEVNA